MKSWGVLLATLLALTACPDNTGDDAGSDAGPTHDATAPGDAARPDTAARPDNALRPDTATAADTATATDHATQTDHAVQTDSATAHDTAIASDSATTTDSAVMHDATVATDSGPACTPQVTAVPPETSLQACIKAYHCAPPASPTDVTDAEGGAIMKCFARHGTYPQPLFQPLAMMLMFERDLRYLNIAILAHEACVAAAADCDGVFRCLNNEVDSPTCTVQGSFRSYGTCADATTLELCYATSVGVTTGRVIKVACPADSPSCVNSGAQGGAFCVKTDCTTQEAAATCSDTVVQQCFATGLHAVRDCNTVNPGAGSTCGDTDPQRADIQAGCVPTGASCAGATDPAVCNGQLVDMCDSHFEQWYTRGDCSAAGPNVYCSADEQYNIPCTVNEANQPCTYKDPVCDCDDFVVCDPKRDSDTRFHCPDYGYRTCGDADLDLAGLQPGCIH